MSKSNRRRQLTGLVVSDKMQKTVVVRVDRTITHPKYLKQFVQSRRFKAHDERGEFHTGDKVMIEETRPQSSGKRWRVMKKL